MALYISLAVGLFALAFLRTIRCLEKGYEPAIVLCLTLLAWAASYLRWGTGTDWDAYLQMFLSLRSISDARMQQWWEPGYSYLSVFIHDAGGGYTAFLLTLATLLFSLKYWLLRRTMTAPLVGVFVLFCLNFYDVYFVRQSVAVIFVWAFAYFTYHHRWLMAVLMAIGAVLFHASAVIVLLLISVVPRVSWRQLILGLGVLAIGVWALTRVSGFSTLMELVGYGMYSEGGLEVKAGAFSTTLRSYAKLTFWVIVLWVAWRYLIPGREQGVDGRWLEFCLKCAASLVGVTLALLPLAEIFSRVPEYGRPLLAVLLSSYSFRITRLSLGGALFVGILLLLFVQLAFLYSGYPERYYPYRSILW